MKPKRWRRILSAAGAFAVAVLAIAVPTTLRQCGRPRTEHRWWLGSRGRIKHVWLIILENKSYDETFTGLNNNSYLWQTLPSEGVLLKNYYGTGHTSMDNYIALASGQAPEADTQNDCATINTPFSDNSHIITTGSVGGDSNWTFGQAVSLQGANAAPTWYIPQLPTAAHIRLRSRRSLTSSTRLA